MRVKSHFYDKHYSLRPLNKPGLAYFRDEHGPLAQLGKEEPNVPKDIRSLTSAQPGMVEQVLNNA